MITISPEDIDWSTKKIETREEGDIIHITMLVKLKRPIVRIVMNLDGILYKKRKFSLRKFKHKRKR